MPTQQPALETKKNIIPEPIAGCWIGNSFYAQNFSGLLSCYAAGIPFYKGTLLGDIFYTTILFGGYYILQKRFSVLKLAYTKYA